MLRYDARDPEASVPDRRNLPAGCLIPALLILAGLAGGCLTLTLILLACWTGALVCAV
jgi:hypothetical protein